MAELAHSLISLATSLIRLVAALIGLKKKDAPPERLLTSRIVESGIVAEFPKHYPLKIVDKDGKQHSGIYIMRLLIWNRGTKTISPTDFMDGAPLRIVLSKDAEIVDATAVSDSKELEYEVLKRGERSIYFDFDGIGPSDYLSIAIVYSGNPMARVQIRGRVRDQASSLDHEAEDSKAGIGERLSNGFILFLILNMIFGTPISAGIIHYMYGWQAMLKQHPDIPIGLVMSFSFGVMLLMITIMTKVMAYFERRKYPPGFPLHLDFEPPFWQGIKYMCSAFFLGEKHRFSTSLFAWAKPVHSRLIKMKRTTKEDWDD